MNADRLIKVPAGTKSRDGNLALRGLPFDERFEAYIQRAEGDACWLWIGPRLAGGYGQIERGGKVILAHRLSYERFVGTIPSGAYICHRCDNPPCVRPDHLFAGTQKENMRDAQAKKRVRGGSSPGERAYNAKLTDDRVRAIRAATLKPGQTDNQLNTELAAQFGVSRTAVHSVRTNKSWTHV